MTFFIYGDYKELDQKEFYDLVINGYDWGPGVDKIILHTKFPVSCDSVKVQDFNVITETYVNNWISYPPKTNLTTGCRTIYSAYTCDETGMEVKNSSCHIALELTVHPDDPFSNPFLYSSDMMNHWQEIYNLKITNSILNINITESGKKICPLADKFTLNKLTTDNITLHYALYEPENSANKTPIIIWLHGMGEGGDDPYIALLGNKVVNLITDDIQSYFAPTGAYVLVPQVNGFWMQTDIKLKGMEGWIGPKSKLTKSCYTTALFNLIDSVVKENPKIDKDRIYIGGCSNGGYMSINMLLEYPDYFAAAYPVCEAYPDCKINEEQIKVLSKQHIWFTQSKDDKTVFPKLFVLPTFKRLQKLKAEDVHLTLWKNVSDNTGNFKDKKGKPYKYNGHFSWVYTLNNQCKENDISIFEWMSKISK